LKQTLLSLHGEKLKVSLYNSLRGREGRVDAAGINLPARIN